MFILVLNSGSSSIKFKVFRKKDQQLVAQGSVDALGLAHSQLEIKDSTNHHFGKKIPNADHRLALEMIFKTLLAHHYVENLQQISLVGHRVVHGGEKYTEPALINKKVIAEIRKLCSLAPLHNPANLEGILACIKLLPKAKQVAVFDTAFHQTMPEIAYLYGLPTELHRKHGIRRYGFHGTNHKYISEQATQLLRKNRQPYGKMITVHLGNGCSATAIRNGKSIDTSMGYTPLEGLIMGTRSGDLDPALIEVISKAKKMTLHQTETFLNKQTGLKGISGLDSDMRTIWQAVQKKHHLATLALDLYCYRIVKYINSYIGVLNGVDAIVFSGGIGEHAWYVREKVCASLKHLGISVSTAKNKQNAQIFSSPSSKAKLIIITANEELEIARQSLKLIS